MFADYRVPQVLVHLEALSYSLELKDLLRKRKLEHFMFSVLDSSILGHLFANGDPMEVEIRGCSIRAVDLIVDKAKSLLQGDSAVHVNAASVDYFLWCYRRKHADELSIVPFHRTRCIYY